MSTATETKLKPLGDRVVVKVLDSEEKKRQDTISPQ